MNVINALYIDDYKIKIVFDDNKTQVVNFLPALKKIQTCSKYLDITLFKKFKIDNGNIVWGKNWDMIFTKESLYKNKLVN